MQKINEGGLKSHQIDFMGIFENWEKHGDMGGKYACARPPRASPGTPEATLACLMTQWVHLMTASRKAGMGGS